MRINTNLAAMNAHRQLGTTTKKLSGSTRKLSSGLKVGVAADDSAGLAISEGMRAQIRGLNTGSKNSQDAISFIQTADGAMSDMHAMINRARELCIQAASDVNEEMDREAIQDEIDEIVGEIQNITDTTTFNTMYVFKEGSMNDSSTPIRSLARIMGKDNIANTDKLTEPFTFPAAPATGWVTSGGGTAGSGAVGAVGVGGATYASAWLDFKGLDDGTFDVTDLIDRGFTSTCATCHNYYSIQFVDGNSEGFAPGVDFKESTGSHRLLQIRVEDITSGADMVDRIMTAINASTGFDDHFTQYAVDTVNEPTKLIIYDNRTSTYTDKPRGGISRFELGPRDTSGKPFEDADEGILWIQNGSNTGDGVFMDKPIMDTKMLGIRDVSVLDHESASKSIKAFDKASAFVSARQSEMGAFQNRFEFSIGVNDISSENLQSAESRIRDVDAAKEMTSLARSQILNQAGTAMLAQANNLPQSVLQLLG